MINVETRNLPVASHKRQRAPIALRRVRRGPGRLRLSVDLSCRRVHERHAFDLSAFLVGADGKVRYSRDFVFYGFMHNSTEGGEVAKPYALEQCRPGFPERLTYDEALYLRLGMLPKDVDRIIVVLSEDGTTGSGMRGLTEFKLGVRQRKGMQLTAEVVYSDMPQSGAIAVGEIFRHDGTWFFQPTGKTFAGGLREACETYGVQLDS